MTQSIRRSTRTLVAVLSALALLLTGLVAQTAQADESPDVLNASSLPIGPITSDLQVGRYTIKATDQRQFDVDAHNRTGGEMQFTQRLKTNGGGDADSRSIMFTTHGEAVLYAYALSASSGTDRHLALYDADFAEVERQPAYGPPTDIPQAMFTIPEAGTYYVASPSAGVNIYHLQLVDGPAPERPAWDTVEAPVITDVTVQDGDIVVDYDGVVGFNGADLATATLYDQDGNVVTTGISGSAAAGGSIALTPTASGAYQVQVELTRNDETTALSSDRTDAPGFVLPLGTTEMVSALTSAVSGVTATVSVEWLAVPEAETYTLSHREVGAGEWTALSPVPGTSADIQGLTPGTEYEVQITTHRGEDQTTSAAFAFTVADQVERWLEAHAGVSSNGTLTHHEDGSMTFDMVPNNGKIADSEDGFYYYYTEVDPATENWTLSATFTVDDASQKDNQSGFGIIAVDTFVPGDRAARYFNSAGTMSAKYIRDEGGEQTVRYGTPGQKIVTGYTDGPTVATPNRDMTNSEPFDWDWRDGMTEGSNMNPPRFTDGDVYEYTLRKSNTGFHSIWTVDGVEHETIHYNPDLLLQQTGDSYYVGVFTARKIVVTVSDLEFTTIHPDDDEEAQEPPTTYITPWLTADVTRTTPHNTIDVPLLSNVHGTAVVLDQAGDVVGGPVDLTPQTISTVTVDLADGVNNYTAQVTPAPREEQVQLGQYEDLASYEATSIPLTVTVDRFGEPGQALYAAPDGGADGDGTRDNPLDLHTAVAWAQPGQQVVLLEGTYLPTRSLVIERGNSGTAEQPITLMSDPGTRAVLDLSESSSGGIILRGDHWHLYNLEITASRGYQKPLLIQGHHNVIERIETHHNGDTGLQISGHATEPPSMWPSHNLVLSSVSHNNADPLANDGDGFAAKLTSGDGNVFRWNIAYNNIDDGWDLYAKSTEGPIGDVVVEHSVTFNNGWLEADTERELTGEGNGFKMGGENMPGAHLLHNSVTFGNLGAGVTSNSGPDVIVTDVTSYGNEGRGLYLYTAAAQTDYEVAGLLSAENGATDSVGLREQTDDITTDASNVFDGTTLGGEPVTDDWFVSTDLTIKPTIAADGSIDMHGLLVLTDQAPGNTGARLDHNPDPTVIDLLPPVEAPSPDPDPVDRIPVDALYVTPGFHNVNGRWWFTQCEPYSQTVRCFTEIWGTKVSYSGGRFVAENTWVFNNITYLPHMTRAQWGDNPLANAGEFTSAGRQWRTECDTSTTGADACRTYILTPNMVQAAQNPDGSWRYFLDDVWVLNNMVLFKK